MLLRHSPRDLRAVLAVVQLVDLEVVQVEELALVVVQLVDLEVVQVEELVLVAPGVGLALAIRAVVPQMSQMEPPRMEPSPMR